MARVKKAEAVARMREEEFSRILMKETLHRAEYGSAAAPRHRTMDEGSQDHRGSSQLTDEPTAE